MSKLYLEELEQRCAPTGIIGQQGAPVVVPNIPKYNADVAQLATLQPSLRSYNNWLGELFVTDVLVSGQMTGAQNGSVGADLNSAQQQSYAGAGFLGMASAQQNAAAQFLAAYNSSIGLANKNYFATLFNQAVNAEANFLSQLSGSINSMSGYESAAEAILQNFTPEQP